MTSNPTSRRSSGETLAVFHPYHHDPEKGHSTAPSPTSSASEVPQEKAPPQSQHNSHLIELEGPNDPLNPLNAPFAKKLLWTAIYGFGTFVVTFSSSAYSASLTGLMQDYQVGQVVATFANTSAFVLAYAFGPQIFGPVSEVFGRKLPFVLGLFVSSIFAIPVATAQNIQTIAICRFFGGLFASAPLSVAAGAFVDIWHSQERAIAVAFFAAMVFVGPTMGPIIGEALAVQTGYSYRWIEIVILCAGLLMSTLAFFFIEETFVPVLLQRKARAKRFETQDWGYYSQLDTVKLDFKEFLTKYLSRPAKMLVLEPVLLAITIYLSFVYGLLYLLFSAVPIVYEGERGMLPVIAALPFLSVLIGVIVAAGVIILHAPRYTRKMVANDNKPVPEERLVPMFFGAIAFPISLFWFAWTASPSHVSSPWPSIISLAFVGFSILLIFIQGLNYIIDCFLFNANSAIAANTFLRSLLGAGFPLFASAMYHNLGTDWATSTLGFIALAMVPIPFAFYKWGPMLRKMSKFAPSL